MSTVILRISPQILPRQAISLSIGSARPVFPPFRPLLPAAAVSFRISALVYIFSFSACHSRDRRKTETYKTESEILPEFGLWIEIERYAAGTGWRKKSLASALQSLYHILRIWQPPAEFSARLSAVNAETGMRRYNARSAVIIPYPSDMLYSPRDAHSPQWYFGSLRAPAARRRYNARSAVIIPCRAVWCPEGSLRFYNFCSFNACFSVLPDCLQIVAGF